MPRVLIDKSAGPSALPERTVNHRQSTSQIGQAGRHQLILCSASRRSVRTECIRHVECRPYHEIDRRRDVVRTIVRHWGQVVKTGSASGLISVEARRERQQVEVLASISVHPFFDARDSKFEPDRGALQLRRDRRSGELGPNHLFVVPSPAVAQGYPQRNPGSGERSKRRSPISSALATPCFGPYRPSECDHRHQRERAHSEEKYGTRNAPHTISHVRPHFCGAS